MRLSFDITSLGGSVPAFDGMSNYLYSLLALLTKYEKFEIFGFGLSSSENLFKSENFTFINIEPYLSGPLFKHEVYYYYINFLLPYLFKKYSIDIFHGTDNINIPIDCREKTKFILTLHDLIFYKGEDVLASERYAFFYRHYAEKAFRRADKIITVSKFSRDEIIKDFPDLKEKIAVINPPLNIDDTSDVPAKVDYEFFLCSSGISPRKNIETLIDAYALSKLSDLGIKLVITGNYSYKDNYVLNLNEKVAHYKLENHVIFTGLLPRSELLSLVKQACCIVSLSLKEGFGLSIAEALAFGIPVIVTKDGSLSEVITQSGDCVDPKDIKMTAKLMSDIFRRKKPKVIGNAQLNNRRILKKFIEVYASLK